MKKVQSSERADQIKVLRIEQNVDLLSNLITRHAWRRNPFTKILENEIEFFVDEVGCIYDQDIGEMVYWCSMKLILDKNGVRPVGKLQFDQLETNMTVDASTIKRVVIESVNFALQQSQDFPRYL